MFDPPQFPELWRIFLEQISEKGAETMLFGLSTKLLRELPMKERILLAAKLQYGAVEFWADDLLESEIPLSEIRELTDAYGICRTVHLRTEDLNIASFNEGIRKESLRQQREGLMLAAKLGAAHATLHPGRKTAKTKSLNEAWSCQIAAIRELALAAAEEGICLCVEGMEKLAGEFVQTPLDLQRVLQECDVPGLAVTLDLAHLHTLGDAVELLKQAAVLPVGEVHISQAAGEKPHLPVFDLRGELRFEDMLPVLRQFYDGPLILEGYIPGMAEELAVRSMAWYRDLAARISIS